VVRNVIMLYTLETFDTAGGMGGWEVGEEDF